MNEELVKKANNAIEDGRLDEGDEELLGMMITQYEKFPESRRIEGSIREIIKRTRVNIVLTSEDLEQIESDAYSMEEILWRYRGISVPTSKRRTFDTIKEAMEKALKENRK